MKFLSSDSIVFIACLSSASALQTSKSMLKVSRLSALSAWPGNRTPIPNVEFLDLSMDAAWGRGKYRTEVWEDDVNPVNDWWAVYAPSEEEIEAAEKGYDFSNPKDWFEAKGIDYETAVAEGKKAAQEKLASIKKAKEAVGALSTEEFLALQEQYFALQRTVFNAAIRQQDNIKQAKKGQPSLDVEDTGTQWRNEPVHND